MPVTHEPWLVVLSLVVAIQGAYVGLSLAVQIGAAAGLRRRLLHAAAALSFAVAIWAMHFVGMLAARLPDPVDYLVFPTLLSFLVCVLVVGVAVFAAGAGPLTMPRLAASAVFMGGGIVSMHYIGMTALHASAHLMHAPAYVGLSAVIAIAASGLALWLAGGGDGRPPLLLSATALGVAIAGMHYTAMAGLTMEPRHVPTIGAPALSSDLLAIVVAIVAFLVSGIFLLALVPDRAGARAAPVAPGSTRTDGGRDDSSVHQEAATASAPVAVAPLIAVDSVAPAAVSRTDTRLGPGEPQPARQLPVERDGTIHYVAVDSIVAVHANAHYAYIFDGSSKLFCPLAIGQIEARLDEARFVRVHRSHIVNLERVAGLRRAGDNGVLELAGRERYTVPVSRSRLRRLKNRLGQRVGEPAA